ncbi:hypothetical protein CORC01_01108, partial [Colletotrichum orchidophilum]
QNDGAEGASFPIFVIWEGDDSEKTKNWLVSKNWVHFLLIPAHTLISPFGSSMFAPSTSETMREFYSANINLESFSVSILVLRHVFGPLIYGPLSELYGRLILYHVNSLLFVIANVAYSLPLSLTMFIVFRLITGIVGSCPPALR